MRIRILLMTCAIIALAGAGTVEAYPYTWCSSMDDVFAEVVGGDLTLHHQGATYNCAPDSFSFAVTVSSDTLYVTENQHLTYPAMCLCCYNLSTTIENLSPGEWQVVYRWYDDDVWVWRDWYLTVTIDAAGSSKSVRIASSDWTDCLDPTGVRGDPEIPVSQAGLLQNTPNPFNPQTTIGFLLPEEAAVGLQVYDVAGRLVDTLLDDEVFPPGRNTVVWRGRDVDGRVMPTGVYFYRLQVGDYIETKRMTLLK